MTLDEYTLLSQIREMGRIGKDKAGGRTRLALTDEDKEARDLLVKWMHELNLDVKIDSIGNIFGILYPQNSSDPSNAVMIGSHIDTVVNAGALDGCYGVLAGLTVARMYRNSGQYPRRPIIVASFTNEEGVRFHPDMTGSLVYAGGYSIDEALDAIGTDGLRFGDELKRIGYAGEMKPGAIVPAEYLELHIEQGPILEAEKFDVGIVENLQGISWQRISISGVANHAGTTPINMRHDAGYAAAEMIVRLRNIALTSGGTTRCTVGTIHFEPNAVNVIPGKAVFTIDLRDPYENSLLASEEKISQHLKEVAKKEHVKITTESISRFKPVKFNTELVDMIEKVSERMGLSSKRMPSGSVHDAQMMARICPTAMIFVPSRRGISHSPKESTDDLKLIYGMRLLFGSVQECMKRTPTEASKDSTTEEKDVL